MARSGSRRMGCVVGAVAMCSVLGGCLDPVRPASQSRWWTGENMTGVLDEVHDPSLAYRWRGATYTELLAYWGEPRWRGYDAEDWPLVGFTKIKKYPRDGEWGITQTFNFVLDDDYHRVIDVHISSPNVWDGKPLAYGGFEW